MKLIILRLTVIAFLCALALGLAHSNTKDIIMGNKDAFALKQLQELIGNSRVDIQESSDKQFEVMQNNKLLGHIIEIQTNEGYNGEIKMWVGISLNREIMGVRVTKHQETPGLGDDLDINISDWILSFNDHSLESRVWKVKKDGGDFDQFSGATITPRAVVAAIKEGLMTFKVSSHNKNVDLKRRSSGD
ncbi:MAG: RnfABCDGE-type electron transport complex G subunit [Candidatus Azotimanducaceae bacterium]|jgi:RnfABCDGE-type electron transport complex G subunit